MSFREAQLVEMLQTLKTQTDEYCDSLGTRAVGRSHDALQQTFQAFKNRAILSCADAIEQHESPQLALQELQTHVDRLLIASKGIDRARAAAAQTPIK
jgi:CMP-N-acetylneuraminic acid synthetase